VFYIGAGFQAFGGLIFAIFAKGEILDWAKDVQQPSEQYKEVVEDKVDRGVLKSEMNGTRSDKDNNGYSETEATKV